MEEQKAREAKIKREIDFILKRAPSCPDPYDGGCIGEHCTRCAVGELMAYIKEEREELCKELEFWKKRELALCAEIRCLQSTIDAQMLEPRPLI